MKSWRNARMNKSTFLKYSRAMPGFFLPTQQIIHCIKVWLLGGRSKNNHYKAVYAGYNTQEINITAAPVVVNASSSSNTTAISKSYYLIGLPVNISLHCT